MGRMRNIPHCWCPVPDVATRETFGQRLKRVRLTTLDDKTGYAMTQKGLAGRLNVTVMAVIYWESGRRWPSGTARMMLSNMWPNEFTPSGDIVH